MQWAARSREGVAVEHCLRRYHREKGRPGAGWVGSVQLHLGVVALLLPGGWLELRSLHPPRPIPPYRRRRQKLAANLPPRSAIGMSCPLAKREGGAPSQLILRAQSPLDPLQPK